MACVCSPPLTPLFIGEGARGAGPSRWDLEEGRRPGRGNLPAKQRGAPPLGFPLNPRRMGPRGGAQPSRSWLLPHAAHVAPREGWPSRWTLGTLPVAPVQYRYAPETFRCPYDSFPYINLYLRTIPELLVMSEISSGTPNNIRFAAYSYSYNPNITEP